MGKRPKLALVDVAERRPAELVSPRGALAQFRQSSAKPSPRDCWPTIPPKARRNWLASSEPGDCVFPRSRCQGRRFPMPGKNIEILLPWDAHQRSEERRVRKEGGRRVRRGG